MAKTVTTISGYMPQDKTLLTKTMLMKGRMPVAILFDKVFWEGQ